MIRIIFRLHHRLAAPATEYAIRPGRARYLRRVSALDGHPAVIIVSPPRSGKSGMLAGLAADHPEENQS